MRFSPRALALTLGMLMAASGVLPANDDVIKPQRLVPDQPPVEESKDRGKEKEAKDTGGREAVGDGESVPLAASDIDGLRRALGQSARVAGRVVRTSNWKDKITFLDFDGGFSVVIFKQHLDAFPEPPEQMYANTTVVVFGTLSEHKGKPQIQIRSPDQIKIVSKDGAAVDGSAAKAGEADKPATDR